jgi:hypothetical protein
VPSPGARTGMRCNKQAVVAARVLTPSYAVSLSVCNGTQDACGRRCARFSRQNCSQFKHHQHVRLMIASQNLLVPLRLFLQSRHFTVSLPLLLPGLLRCSPGCQQSLQSLATHDMSAAMGHRPRPGTPARCHSPRPAQPTRVASGAQVWQDACQARAAQPHLRRSADRAS